MKKTLLSPQQNQRVESLCEKVGKFTRGQHLDFKGLMADAKKELARKGFNLEVIKTRRCLFSYIHVERTDRENQAIYVVYSEILERKKPKAHRYGLAYQSYMVLQCTLQDETFDNNSLAALDEEAHHFARKTTNYNFSLLKIAPSLPVYFFIHPIRWYREMEGSESYKSRIVKNHKKSQKQ